MPTIAPDRVASVSTASASPVPTSTVLLADAILTPEGWVVDGAVRCDGDGIIAVEGGLLLDEPPIEAVDLLLPGIVDLHGDGFERAIEPRPGVALPIALALRENDRAMLAAGITTAFLSATDSFEPGLRSRATVRGLVAALGDPSLPLGCDTGLHIRHEICATADHQELVDWIAAGQVQLLSTADHLPAPGETRKLERFMAAVTRRLRLDSGELAALMATATGNRMLGRQQEQELAELARRCHVPLASHDDASEASLQAAVARGVAIAEFPLSRELAARARELGLAVLLGAPNAVRGGSHLGLWSVREAVEHGLCDLLASDYHYPSLFHAPFRLVQDLGVPLAEAWALVSTAPAQLAGLSAKGRIQAGAVADLLRVDLTGTVPDLREVWVGGRQVATFA